MIVTVRKIPFKIVLKEGRPLVLEVVIRNTSTSERRYVVSVETGQALSLSPSGLAKFGEKRTGNVLPGNSAVVSFKIYPRPTTKPGDYEVKVRVEEAVESYENVLGEKEISVRVPVI